LAFLLLAIAFLLVLTLHFSWELSRLEDRTRRLAEVCALLSEGRSSFADDTEMSSNARPASNDDQTVSRERSTKPSGDHLEPT
jgi:hypothetical protein